MSGIEGNITFKIFKYGTGVGSPLQENFHQILLNVKKCGFDSIEINVASIHEVLHKIPDSFFSGIKEVVESLSLDVCAVHSINYWKTAYEETVHVFNKYTNLYKEKIMKWGIENSFEEQKKYCEIANILGAKCLVIHLGGRAETSITYNDWKESIFWDGEVTKRVAEYASKYNLKIALENASIYTMNYLYEVVDYVNMENVGYTFDTGHWNLNPTGKISDVVKKMGQKLFHLHIHDNHGKFDEHLLMGEGEIDWRDFFSALKEISYGGVVTLETDWLKNIDKTIKCLEVMKEYLKS